MPSIKKMTTKAGKVFYLIRASRGRGTAPLSTRWYPEESWSPRYVERELKKYAAEFERKVQAGEIISRAEQKELEQEARREAAKIMTIHQYAEAVFMPTKTVTMSENSRYTYQGNLERWIYPAIGDLKLPDVTQAHISALLLSMQSKGKAHSTCIMVYSILNSLFKMAYMADVITRNPMDKVVRPKPRKGEVQRSDVEAYTPEEVQKILSALDQEPLKWRAVLMLLIDTGIRRGECLGLQWKDVDFKKNTITIAGNLCYTPDKGVYLDIPKTSRTRTIDVDPDVLTLLKLLRTEQASKVISSYVFTQEGSSAPLLPNELNWYMDKLSSRYDIPHFHPHKLRHTFASIAITSGADVASVSEKLGHSNKAFTLQMYTHANQESMKRASQIFRNALKKAGQE